jgi:release factor glutamine methyltransferase
MRSEAPIPFDDDFGPARSLFRKLVHFFSYNFILTRRRHTTTRVSGLELDVPPTVFHPKIFLTSAFFAKFLQSQDFAGKSVIEVGCGSGILSLSAAKAGATSVLALDINPAAVEATRINAAKNKLPQVTSLQSDLFSGLPAVATADVIITSPPSFSGEPRDAADRAWHAGPGYRDILSLFDQAAQHLNAEGKIYLLISSDTNQKLMDHLIRSAGFIGKEVAERSILVERFIIFELKRASPKTTPEKITSHELGHGQP